MSRRLFLIKYLLSMFVAFAILVIGNIFLKIYEGTLLQSLLWALSSVLLTWQGLFSIISMGLFLALILKDKIVRDFVFPFGMLVSFLILGINKVLWSLESKWYEVMASVLLYEYNWIAMIFGAFIFLFFYKKFKRARR